MFTKIFAAFLFGIFVLDNAVYAAPTLTDFLPANNSFFGRGSVNFYVNVTGSVPLSSVTLFVISEDAYKNGELWDNYTMSCTGQNNCTKTVSFVIAGTDTLEFFYFSAMDTSGDTGYLGNTTHPMVFKLDRNPPIITFVRPKNASYVGGNVTVEVTATDAISGVNSSSLGLSFDNITWSNMSGYIGYFNSSGYSDNQTLTVYVKASDKLNNVGTASINVTVDNEPPKISVLSHPDNSTIKETVTFTINVTDAYSGMDKNNIKARLGSSTAAMTCPDVCSATFNTLQLPDNAYTLTFIAYDVAGNYNSSSIFVTINNNRPIIALAPEGYAKGTITLSATITNPADIIGSVSLKIEKSGAVSTSTMSCNSQFTFCSYALDTPTLGDGTYIVTANASNILNYAITDSNTIIADNTNPSITIKVPEFVKGLFTINADIIDTNHDRTAVNYLIKAGGAMSCVAQDNRLLCDTKYDASGLADGFYELNITATDLARNSFTKSQTIGVDNKPPSFGFLKIQPTSASGATSVEFTVGAEDSVSGVKAASVLVDHLYSKNTVSLIKNGGVWINKILIREPGSYKVSVILEDNMGNSKTFDSVGYFFVGQLSCSDGVCSPSENYCLCPKDCAPPACSGGLKVECGSGTPTCLAPASCGDGVCSAAESCSSCSVDCGSCEYLPGGDQPLDKTDKTDNPLSLGEGSFSSTVSSDPMFFTMIGVILIAVSIIITKSRKTKSSWSKSK